MRRLGQITTIDVWEGGRDLDPTGRALVMWEATGTRPGTDPAELPVGTRDADLLASRIATFGPTASGYAQCPVCSTGLELALDLSQFHLGAPDPAARCTVSHEQWQVELRLPTTRDIRAVRDLPDPRRALLERCVLAVTYRSAPKAAADLPETLVPVIDRAMQQADPQSDITLELCCAACDHTWVARFDIAHFYWREIDVEARRLLAQVHVLARAYGWTEPQVLALTPARRRAYLDLVGGSA